MATRSTDASLILDYLCARPGQWRGALNLDVVQAAASELGVQLTRTVWAELSENSRDGRLLPEVVCEFLLTLAESLQPRHVLNLWSGDGVLTLDLQERLPQAETVAVEPQASAVDVGRFFDAEGAIRWITGRPRQVADEVPHWGQYDLIVSTAPWGVRREKFETRSLDGDPLSISDEEGRIDLVQYAPALADDGRVVLLATSNILFAPKSRKLLDALKRQGLQLEAAISMPAGTFAPVTNGSAVIAVFSKQPHEQIFMAELPESPEAQAQLVLNVAARRARKAPELGVLVPIDELVPFESLVATREVNRSLKATGVAIETLATLAVAINRPIEREGRLTFDDAPNSFFMPLAGFGPPRLDLPEKISKEWVQVVLDPDQALAEHVVRWLSSPVGRRAREAQASGAWIPRVSANAVAALPIPVPDVDAQDRALALDAQLAAVSAEVDHLREDLLNRPRRLREIARRTERLAHREGKPDWIDSLPLPLATVGRAYYARQDTRQRMDSLFHFFEAMAEFHAAVLLSGISTDSDYFMRARDELLGPASDRRRYYENATLGGWTTMATRLSKELRRLMSRPESDKEPGRDTVMRWFGRPESEWLDMITSAALYSTLDEAKRRRNDWKGHGGAASDGVNRERLSELERLLASVRSIIAGRWDDATLVSPVGMSLRDGVLETTVDVLVGTALPFRQERLGTTDPLDSAYLHLVHSGGPTSLRLLPLVRMMSSPATANVACYFYNRITDGEVRYVSYYYEEDSETVKPRDEAASSAVIAALGIGVE